MADQETLNTEGQEDQDGAPSTPQESGDLISTMELAEKAKSAAAAEPEKPDKAEGDDKGKKAGEEPTEKAKGKGGDEKKAKETKAKEIPPTEKKDEVKAKGKEPVPYDRFSTVVKERNDERESRAREREDHAKEIGELRGELNAIKEQIGKKGKPATDYKNVLKMSDREIREALSEEDGDIKGFLADYGRQIEGEILEKLEGKFVSEGKIKEIAKGTLDEGKTAEQEQAFNKKIEAGYRTFAEANEGFDQVWDTGELQEFCDEHPEHTPISAFFVMNQEKDKKTLDEQVAEAVEAKREEIEKEVREELKTKRGARVLSEGPAAQPTGDGIDPRFKDSKKHGGPVALITKHLEEQEAEARGG